MQVLFGPALGILAFGQKAVAGSGLEFSPHPPAAMAGATLALEVDGAVAPLKFAAISGPCHVDQSTGLVTIPSGVAVSLCEIQVQDASAATASTSIFAVPALQLSTTRSQILPGGTLSISASGGVAPYVFSVAGRGAIDAESGVYHAPQTVGVDTVEATDAIGDRVSAEVETFAVTQVNGSTECPCALLSSGTVECHMLNGNGCLDHPNAPTGLPPDQAFVDPGISGVVGLAVGNIFNASTV